MKAEIRFVQKGGSEEQQLSETYCNKKYNALLLKYQQICARKEKHLTSHQKGHLVVRTKRLPRTRLMVATTGLLGFAVLIRISIVITQ